VSWDSGQQLFSSPEPTLLDKVLTFMKAQGASDLHLSRGTFMARIHGELKPLQGIPSQSPEQVVQLLSTLTAPTPRLMATDFESTFIFNAGKSERFSVRFLAKSGH
jgi:Tfp pilus assembly pilus retraction ATPase PilT